MNQVGMLNLLDEQVVRACVRCPNLCNSRTKTVFGEGNSSASIMFIGEAPGHHEDLEGRPFVGPAGQLLDDIIVACGLRRQDVYIANILKCHPPANRRPSHEEAKNCRPYLEMQIKIINPKYLVCLGATAAQRILKQFDSNISSLRGVLHEYEGRKVLCTYHPSYVLQAPDNKKDDIKRDIWADMQLLLAHARQAT